MVLKDAMQYGKKKVFLSQVSKASGAELHTNQSSRRTRYTYRYGTEGHISMQMASLLRHLISSLQSLCGDGYNSRCPRVYRRDFNNCNRYPHVKAAYDGGALRKDTCDDAFHS